ncbi:MarR family winged helix-turn-helix transcriptional regulator [Glaciibacter psychrotolerans]|uniref:DNA-binding MarR family transcriptional regulator n=1 Tax=Glaciibacter psychrotolerans TaxID=670054 RepID=A0A7Z0J768_9MICO|nr:MarR family transcriptional regulator [Leifsonia psychrotolerans]NYJ20633.1 DNA-binding MarR family transcriptional regulator [Leifsonia psychrotolerans]
MTENASTDTRARLCSCLCSCADVPSSQRAAGSEGASDAVAVAIAEVEEQIGVLAGHIRASIRIAAISIDPALQPFGLKMLRVLTAHGPMHASKLAEVMLVDRSIISRQTRQLHELGLVELQTDPDDGRARYVAATAVAMERLNAVRTGDELAIVTHMSTWPVDDLRQFTGLLKRLTQSDS